MANSFLFHELAPKQVALTDIYLDPNNPRFVGSSWTYIDQMDIDKSINQERARQLLVEKFEVEKLKANMEVNGYLPIDRVIVREFKPQRYVVLEGNRRICAAKLIVEYAHVSPNLFPNPILESFAEVPCLVYTGADPDAAWVFQGLRHISGLVEWTAFNKAQLLVEQMEREQLTLTEVGRRFGLTAYGAGQWVRGYKAFHQAKSKTDYAYDVDERAYPYFQELFGRSTTSLREWLQWDESNKAFRNEMAFNEFVGWLYPRDDSDDDRAVSTGKGDWNKRVLNTRDDLRNLAYLVREAPDAFEQFRQSKKLEEVYSLALAKQFEQKARESLDRVSEVFEAIRVCADRLDNAPIRILRKADYTTRLKQDLGMLREAIQVIEDTISGE